MQINLSPQRRDDTLTLSRAGDVLTINGDDLDMSGIPEGATLPASAVASDWVTGPISRTSGVLSLTIRMPIGPGASEALCFPAPITVTDDGPVDLPTDEAPE